MRITIELPDEWSEDLKRAVSDSGAQSRKAYIEGLVAERLDRAFQKNAWGGRRPYGQDMQDGKIVQPKQDESVAQVEQDMQLASSAVFAPSDVALTPAQKIAARKAAARQKFTPPIDKKNPPE